MIPEPFAEPAAVRRLRDRFRAAAFIVLIVGVVGAGLLYWLETRSAQPSMEELMPGYTKMNDRQMGILFGQTGVFLSDGLDKLKQPGVQAIILVVAALLIAWGCFHVSRLLDQSQEDGPSAR
ncbi:MAG: hypothetical protein KGN76_04370 [Acidobacteriota bacterium]|nr:hypothetical protein [Acidobacteriota bacterium]